MALPLFAWVWKGAVLYFGNNNSLCQIEAKFFKQKEEDCRSWCEMRVLVEVCCKI